MIDAHQHFWSIGRGDYGWLTPDLHALYRDFTPDDLAPHMQLAGVQETVVVQAAATVEETRFLLDLARATPWVSGVVGWVDLESDTVAETLDSLMIDSAFRGVRPMIQDIPDPNWMLGRAVGRGLCALVERELRFDALVNPLHLSCLRELLERNPELRVVIDHGGKPDIRNDGFSEWADDIARLASETACFCKLSGLVTEAAEPWAVGDIEPYAAHLLECFGPERIMWGSDWPVVELAGGYDSWRSATLRLVSRFDEQSRRDVLGESARRFYGLPLQDGREEETS